MTFPNRTDAAFHAFMSQPAWARKISPQAEAPIDACVNSHAGQRWTSGELAANNLGAIVKGWIRRGEPLQARLLAVAEQPQCAINPEKRAAFALKWAKRMKAIDERSRNH